MFQSPDVILSSKFRNAQGIRYTKQLFYETARQGEATILYSLKDRDWAGYPSLYRLYLNEEDPFEYNFAVKYFEGYEHWLMLSEAEWFKPYINRWRSELALKLQSAALVRLRDDAQSGSRSSAASNKYLLERGWKVDATTKNGRGRPSKEQVKDEARRIADLNRSVDEDIARLGTPETVPSTETVN